MASLRLRSHSTVSDSCKVGSCGRGPAGGWQGPRELFRNQKTEGRPCLTGSQATQLFPCHCPLPERRLSRSFWDPKGRIPSIEDIFGQVDHSPWRWRVALALFVIGMSGLLWGIFLTMAPQTHSCLVFPKSLAHLPDFRPCLTPFPVSVRRPCPMFLWRTC